MQQESEKKIWKSWFCIKIFTTRQILTYKFHDASDFEEDYIFKKHDSEEKIIFNSAILKKKLFL